jgi:hypothetical protein
MQGLNNASSFCQHMAALTTPWRMPSAFQARTNRVFLPSLGQVRGKRFIKNLDKGLN